MNRIGHQSPDLWRHPQDRSESCNSLEYWTDLGRVIVTSNVDYVFIAQVAGDCDVDMSIALLLAKQNASLPRAPARRAYVLETERVALAGPATEIAARDDLHPIYRDHVASA